MYRDVSMPLVSLVVPTYNRSGFLQEALSSALAQTYPRLEIVVLDDASSDQTPATVEQLANPRIRYVRHASNKGPNANWRAAMQAATGDVFGFLADDDLLSPHYVEHLTRPLHKNEDLILSFSDHWVIDAHGDRQVETSMQLAKHYRRFNRPEGIVEHPERALLVDDAVYIGAILFRRSHVSPSFLVPRARSAMGAWILYRCVKTGRPCYYVPERLMSCRWQAGSVSRSRRWRSSITEGNVARYRVILQDPEMRSIHSAIRRKLASALEARGRWYLTHGETKASQRDFRKAWRLEPTWRRAFARGLAHLGPVGQWVAQGIRKAKANT